MPSAWSGSLCEGCTRGAAPLCTPRSKSVDLASTPPKEGAPPLRPRVTFPSRGKSPKARQGLRPLESPSVWSPPFSRSLRCAPSRAGLPSASDPDRFATLSWWANRSFFLPEFYRGSHFLLLIRGSVGGVPSRMPLAFLPATNTARAEGGGIQGGPPPCAGGPGTRRFLAYLCLLSLREKVGRGAGRSARIRRRRDHVPASIPPGTEAPPFYKNPASKQNTRCGIEKTINPPSGSGQSSKKINTLCPR